MTKKLYLCTHFQNLLFSFPFMPFIHRNQTGETLSRENRNVPKYYQSTTKSTINMGKVTLNKKFKSYTGQLPPNGHRFYLTNRFGEEIISHMPEHRDPDSVTEAQRHAFQLIKEASAKADADLRDPVKHDEWLQKWHASLSSPATRHYKTLRGFVIAQYRQQSN